MSRPGMLRRGVTGDADRDTTSARDRGSALPMVLVMTVIVSMIVLPAMTYAVTIMRANTVLSEKSHRIESVKAGLRVALAQPGELYKTCADAGATVPVQLADMQINDLNVSTRCYSLDVAYTVNPAEVRKGLVSTRVGATIPAILRTTGDDNAVYQATADPTEWQGLTSLDSELDKIWLPNLPVHALSPRSPVGTEMADGFPDCTVYFPGTYVDELVLDGPTFFTSGIYYFQNNVRVTAGATVVVGDGAVPGCTSSQEAVFYAENVPSTHNLSGLGGTWVLGDKARVLVDNAAGDVSLRFNTRYASSEDPGDAPSQDVSIISVNGDLQADGVTGTVLDVPGSINVPLSKVGIDDPADPVYATEQDYLPSIVTPKPRVAEAPVSVNATRYRSAAVVTWSPPPFDGGSQVTGYRVTASSGPTCTTNGALTCALTGLASTNTTFSVVAINAVGESAPSEPSSSVSISSSTSITALAVPAAPTPPTATAHLGGTVRVAWAAPASTAPITSYTVTATPGGATCTVDMTRSFTPERKCDITGLNLLTSYRFTVTASNAVGMSAPSGNSALLTFPVLGLTNPAPLAGPPAYVASIPALIDMQLGGPGAAIIEVPGYVSIPQGRINISNPNGQPVRVAGGILAAQIDVDDTRPSPPIGFVDTIAQRKLKVVSVSDAGGETSTAVVQINQNGAYAVNSWEVQ